jgi:hypothetical protein
MLRRPKHSMIEVVATKEEEVLRSQVHGNCRKKEI